MKAALGLMIALAVAPSAASATPKSELAAIDARLKVCMDKDSSNLGMKTCTGDAYDAADKILNKVYNSAAANLKKVSKDTDVVQNNNETLKRLIASERAWIAYRDADCDLQGTEMLGGSGENLVIVSCQLSMTEQRVKALDELFREK